MSRLLPRSVRTLLSRAVFGAVEAFASTLQQWAKSKRNPVQPDRIRDDERGLSMGDE